MSKTRTLVSFEARQGGYMAFADLGCMLDDDCGDLEKRLHCASELYSRSIASLGLMVAERNTLRDRRAPLPAALVWRIGRAVWDLQEGLDAIGLELDGVYDHLSRDAGVKRKSLEKAVIFGRYIARESDIPIGLRWGKCEHGTRRIALQIAQGKYHEAER